MNTGLLCDMHVHSQSSHDSTAPVIDSAEACIKNNVSVLAITDHCDIQYYIEHDILSCIKRSVDEVIEASRLYKGKVKILKGIEIGEGIWSKKYTDEILNAFDFDVIISSVHAVRYKDYSDPYAIIDFSKMTATELDEFMDMYFDEVLEMLSKIPCDIMAHLTCPLRYINGKYKLNVDIKKFENKIIKILEFIIDNSISMEINTSGIGIAYESLMPDTWIIKKFKEMGGYLVTLGSDAHISENVGKGFDSAIALLKKHGFNGYYYYENRKRVFCEI